MVRAIFSFRTLFYFLYAFVLITALLYIRFPTEKVKKYCEKRIEHLLPPERMCRIDRLSYQFPVSVKATNIQISEVVDGKNSQLLVNRLVVSPDFENLPRAFILNGEIYQGSFALKLTVDVQEKGFKLSEIYLNGFDLEKWVNDFGLLDRKVSGIVGFTGTFQGKFTNPLEGEGMGKLVVVDGSMELVQPVLSLSSLEFERIAVDMTHKKGVLGFIGGEVLGKEITADFTGQMQTTIPLIDSNVFISGNLAPKEGFFASHPAEKQVVEQLLRRFKTPGLPFKVGGSVRRPTFRFSS
jgi:type II secretion system protein N